MVDTLPEGSGTLPKSSEVLEGAGYSCPVVGGRRGSDTQPTQEGLGMKTAQEQ